MANNNEDMTMGGKDNTNSCNRTFTVKVNTRLRVRSGAGMAFPVIGYLHNGDVITASKYANENWYYIDYVGGWCCQSSGEESYLIGDQNQPINENIQEVPKEVLEQTSTPDITEEQPDNIVGNYVTDDETEYYPNIYDYSDVDNNVLESIISSNLRGILGLPYQFMPTVDRRLKDNSGKNIRYGRKYAEKIITRMPLLLLTPGRPNFMRTFSKEQKEGAITALVDAAYGDINGDDLDGILTDYGRYYTFEFAYKEYFEYVNPALRSLAILLDLGDKTVTIGNESAKLRYFNWENTLSSDFKKYISGMEAIPFYVDAETSVSESFSNSTSESMLSQKMNSMGDLAKEASFILGVSSGKQIAALSQSGYDDTLSQINKVIDDSLNGNRLLKRISTGFSTVATGGKLVFPEIWQDSEFSKSYSVNIKLRSPDNDIFSIYLNILVPYVFLVCMTAAQRLGTNGYASPFLVRANYKSIINVDTGIITDLSATRGKEGSWNLRGLSSEMDIQLTIKDLYNSMYISKVDSLISSSGGNGKVGQFLNNTNYMDFLCQLAGVDLNKMESDKLIELYLSFYANKVLDTPNTLINKFYQTISRMSSNLLDNISRKY